MAKYGLGLDRQLSQEGQSPATLPHQSLLMRQQIPSMKLRDVLIFFAKTWYTYLLAFGLR